MSTIVRNTILNTVCFLVNSLKSDSNYVYVTYEITVFDHRSIVVAIDCCGFEP